MVRMGFPYSDDAVVVGISVADSYRWAAQPSRRGTASGLAQATFLYIFSGADRSFAVGFRGFDWRDLVFPKRTRPHNSTLRRF